MELNNNLTSLLANERFNIKNLDNLKRIHSLQYKQIFAYLEERAQAAQGEYNFLNVLNGVNFSLSKKDMLEFYEKLENYITYEMQTAANNTKIFLPILEIPSKYSTPTFCITIPNLVEHISSSSYQIWQSELPKLNGLIKKTADKLAEVLPELLEVPELKTDLVVFQMANDCALVLKFQVLNVRTTMQANLQIASEMQKLYESMYINKNTGKFKQISGCVNIFSDLQITSANPEFGRWHLAKLYNLDFAYETADAVERNVSEFAGKLGAFSANFEPVGYSKTLFKTKFDSDEKVQEFSAIAEKMKLFFANPHAEYIWKVLEELPEEYWENERLWKELIKSARGGNEAYKILYKEKSVRFAEEFEGEWCKVDNKARVKQGFYYQLCSENSGFAKDITEFLATLLENKLYKKKFDLSYGEIADFVLTYINGKYYYDPHEPKNKWFSYVGPKDDINFGELYKWRSSAQDDELRYMLIEEFLPIITRIYEKIDSKLDPAKCKELKKKIASASKSLSTPTWLTGVISILRSKVKFNDFGKILDSYPDVRGTKNGTLEFICEGCEFAPTLRQGYSKYFISKSIRANYCEYAKSPATQLWKQIFKDAIIEPDARKAIQYFLATGLDEMTKKIKALKMIGGGSNGKSVILDNVLYVLGGYGTKLSTTLITSAKRGGGATDEDYMQLKGHSFGVMTETDNGDKLIGSRLKSLGEAEKTGRKLYQSNESFASETTIAIATNFALAVDDNDGGTWRRLLCYIFKVKFTDKPDPNCSTEKKANRTFETLAAKSPEHADALLSLLVHWRIKFHTKYNSDIEKVFADSPTILRESEEYRRDQDEITKFLHTKVVRVYGYNTNHTLYLEWSEVEKYYLENNKAIAEIITAETFAEEYHKWFALTVRSGEKLNISDTIKKFRTSKIKNYWEEIGRSIGIRGFRILAREEAKLPNESFIS